MEENNRKRREKCIERWMKSGLSRKEFAALEGIGEQKLSTWKWSLGVQRRAANKLRPLHAKAGFVEIVEASAAPVERSNEGCRSFVVQLASGARVIIPACFDASALRRLLAVLEHS